MSEAQTLALTILSSAGASIALSGAIVWLARTWIGERLQASIKHEYDQRLAALNAELRSRGDAHLATLKAEIDRQSEKLRITSLSFTEVQKAAIARKLDAIDVLWAGILSAREAIPPIMNFIDILTVDEYVDAKNHPTFRSLTGELDQAKVMKIAMDAQGTLERVRPYVGEYIWALFATYQAVMMRTIFLIHLSKEDSAKLNWHQDSGVRQLISSAFGSKGLDEFDQVRIGKIGWLGVQFESLVLAAMEKLIAGKEFGEAAFQQAQAMENQIRLSKPELSSGSPAKM
jgi:hypothetical protein